MNIEGGNQQLPQKPPSPEPPWRSVPSQASCSLSSLSKDQGQASREQDWDQGTEFKEALSLRFVQVPKLHLCEPGIESLLKFRILGTLQASS